jgi:excinuclease ABC subunit A
VVARQDRAQAVRYSRVRNRGRSDTFVATLEKVDVESLALNEAAASYRQMQETCTMLTLSNATKHNLKELTVEIPIGRFVCITGVSGSGKTTLVREVLLPTLAANLNAQLPNTKASDRLQAEQNDESDDDESSSGSGATLDPTPSTLLSCVVLVDQSILGKTPRSNPAVYIGAFDDIREVFSQSDLAKQRGFNASAFSFNSTQGQCERCRGAGFEKIEMQFLSDVFIRCPDCNGRRYRPHILEVKISPAAEIQSSKSNGASKQGAKEENYGSRPLSIADLLDSTIEEAIEFLSGFTESRPAQRAVASLKLLSEVGLGYLKLGQPINTLSGGESQRLKLVRHLADAALEAETNSRSLPTLFLFDEPTTGLHFDDVRVLLKVFQRLVDAGHSVLVIEHNLDVIKSADWVIDLGPDAGDQGGQVVAAGTPEQIVQVDTSHTGKALRAVLRVPGRELHV